MDAFTRLQSHAAILPGDDIDTDIIFPARFLLITKKIGLGKYAFYEKRHGVDGQSLEFPLDRALADGARILIAGHNFGCGSSREQAVWALHDLGLRCLIAPSFGEIFHANCYRSGILPIALPAESVTSLRATDGPLTVDLAAKEIRTADGGVTAFDLPDWRRNALLNGWDEVLTLLNERGDEIAAFEQRRRAAAPWLFTAG